MTENEIDAIRKRLEACPIPENAEADWRDTNHFEIQVRSDVDDFWWLDVFDVPQDSSTEDGRRLGAVLDYACAYRRDVGVLLATVDEERALLDWLAEDYDPDVNGENPPDSIMKAIMLGDPVQLRAAIDAAGEGGG